MASITLAGTLLDPNSDLSVGDEIRFTHQSTTGQTVKSAVSLVSIPPNGTYSVPLQYGLILVEYKDIRSTHFKNLGIVTVNGSTTATSIPEILNSAVPVTNPVILEMEALITDARDSYKNGVLTFSTYALLTAFTPATLDHQLSSFKVTNDSTSSLNGYYSWVSGTTYTKDADLVKNVIDANNTSDAVSGAAVAAYVPDSAVLLNKTVSNIDGSIVDFVGRVQINRFFPISESPEVSFSQAGTVYYRYYDIELQFIGTSYTVDAKYVKAGLVASGTAVTPADAAQITCTVNSVTYRCVQELPIDNDFLGDETAFLLNKTISNIDGKIVDFVGRVQINRFFPISADPTFSFSQAGTVYYRYYDIELQFIGTSYTVDAKYVKAGLVASGTAVTPADAAQITFAFNGVTYRCIDELPIDNDFLGENAGKKRSDIVVGLFLRYKSEINLTQTNINDSSNTCDIEVAVGLMVTVTGDKYISSATVIRTSVPYKYGCLYIKIDVDDNVIGYEIGNIGAFVGDLLDVQTGFYYVPILAWRGEDIIYKAYEYSSGISTVGTFDTVVRGDTGGTRTNSWLSTPNWSEDQGKCIVFPVDAFDVVKIQAGNEDLYYGFLSQEPNLDTQTAVPYVTGRVTVTDKLLKTVVAPSGALFLAVGLLDFSSLNHAPSILTINGVNALQSLYKNISEAAGTTTSEYFENFMQIFPKYTVLGDSLTAGFTSLGGSSIGSATARPLKNNWVGYLEKRLGQTMTNLAIGSSTTHHWRYTDGPTVPSNVADITDANIPTDCYIIYLGTNDSRQSLTLGSTSDIAVDKANNSNTVYGNYDYIIRKLKEYNPYSHFFIMTLPPSETSAGTYNPAIRYMETIHTDVHLIDIYNIYYTEFTTGLLNNYYDGHWSPIGYNYISSLFEKAINNYMNENPASFIRVPYE